MSEKLLHQLLQEDQEPFLLTNYIADRRLNLHPDRPKKLPVSSGFRKHVCFFALNNSPDLRNSPIFQYRSPSRSTANGVFLNVPTRTADLLLEAALRIKKPCNSSSKDTKTQVKSLFGSLFKRLTNSNKLSERDRGVRLSTKESFVDKSTKKVINRGKELKRSDYYDARCSCSCNGRTSGTIWSESSEEKSMDLDMSFSSISSRYLEDQEERLVTNVDAVINEHYVIGDDSYGFDSDCCENSPFRFVLRQSPCSSYRTPELASRATSPCPFNIEGKDDNNEKEEQCSPVSVLDPTFEEDDDHDQMEDHRNFNMECSYAIVPDVKNQLLQKLRRFEKLAELDPVELEKLMLEAEDEGSIDYVKAEACREEEKEEISNVDKYVVEELGKSRKIWIVGDLVDEDKRDAEQVARVLRRSETWKEVEFYTLEMMVEHGTRREDEEWKRSRQEEIREVAFEIELRTLGALLDELTEELRG